MDARSSFPESYGTDRLWYTGLARLARESRLMVSRPSMPAPAQL